MDVTCERCSTEYEFDDALVSERGTTVKCTTCGHQFKVRRSDGLTAPERWVVRTVDGREIEFTALRELQAAISQARVTRDDVLARGGARPRRLGSIAELEPFFVGAGGISMPSTAPAPPIGPRSRTPTPQGLGVVGSMGRFEGSVAIPLPTAPRRSHDEDWPATAPRQRPASIPPVPMPPPNRKSIPPPGVVVAPENAPPLPPPPHSESMVATLPHLPPPFLRSPSAPPPGFPPPPTYQPPLPAPPPPAQLPSFADRPPMDAATARYDAPVLGRAEERPDAASLGPGRSTLRQGTPERLSSNGETRPSISTPPPQTPTPGPARSSFTDEATYADPRFSAPVASRRAGGARLIVGVVFLGLVLFLGATVGRKYLAGDAKHASGVSDERIATLLHDGDRSLLDGDIETANELLAKASGAAEADPRVASALARLAAIKADQRWLRGRLLPAGDAELGTAKQELDDAIVRLKQATARAAELAPSDPVTIRAQIDALRIAGDRVAARKLVPSLGAASSQPESALSLAAIDLAEDKPSYGELVERLRTAAASEQNLGRARGMLVYALARSGDAAGAKTELDRLGAMPRPYPLVKLLQAFAARAEKDGKSVDVSSLPDSAAGEVPADYRDCIKLGSEARGKGDLKRAEALFAAALQKSPGDAEATAGLADVARGNKDTARATKLYEQLLAQNPGYLPALGGLADMKWDGGDRAAATALYKQVLEKTTSGPYAARAKERLGQGSGAAHPAGERPRPEGAVPDDYVAPQATAHVDTGDLPGSKGKPPPTSDLPGPSPTAQPTPPPGPPPGIDTSDLPGLK